MNRSKIVKAVYLAAVIYVGITGVYYFVDSFFIKRRPNDQCLWVEEKAGDKKQIVIREILEGGVADKAGIKDGDILIAINDTMLRSNNHASQILNRAQSGDVLMYTVIRNGQVLRLPLEVAMTMNTLYLGFALLGFGFLVVGWMVGMARPGERVPSLFFKMAMFGALVFILGGAAIGFSYNGTAFWFLNVLFGYILFPALFVHFFLVFPHEKLSPKTARWLIPSIYIFSLLNVVYFAAIAILYNQGPAVSVFIFFSMMGTGFGLFCSSYFKLKDPKQRKPLKSILIGSAIGFSGFLYLLIIPNFSIAIFINYPEALTPVAIVALIPLSFGYSIFRYRTMDIEVIIKKSLVYAATTASVAVVYLAVLLIMGYVVQDWIGDGSQNSYLQFGVLLIAAFVFAPMKERIQTVVDKRFFRERYNYQKALLDFSRELPHLTQLDEILQKVIYTVTGTMHIESMAIALYENSPRPVNYVHRGIAEGSCDLENTPGGLIAWLTKTRQPQLLDPVNLDELAIPDSEKQAIRNCRIVLAVPMAKQDQLTGVLFMGAKLSEKPFVQEDMDLLTTVAGQAGIAIENARLIKEELEKAKLENELNVARRIQQSLLPARSPDIPGLDITGLSLPAMSVGGDYFDYIPLDEHRLLIAVGDVSGKGVSAALYMSKIQGMIQIASRLYQSPREILIEVNQWMYQGMERQSFVTMIVGLIDLQKHTMSICRAGHNPAIAMHEGQLQLIRCKGLGVGLVPGEMFEKNLEEEISSLQTGYTYVFYTDGVTEAMNSRNEEFGEERLYALVQSRKDATSGQLLQAIVEDVQSFCSGVDQHDDITVVIVKMKS